MAEMHKDLIGRLIRAAVDHFPDKLSEKDRVMVCHYIKDLNPHRSIESLASKSANELYAIFRNEQMQDYLESEKDWDHTGQI